MKKTLKYIAIFIIIALTVVFFIIQLTSNWNEIKEVSFKLDIRYAIFSILFMVFVYLAQTYCWHCLINETHIDIAKMRLKQSVGVHNITGLAKYIPGRLWAYGIQMYVLGNNGFSAAKVLFANVILIFLGLLVTLVAAFYYFLFNFLNIGISLKYIVATIAIAIFILCLVFIEKLFDILSIIIRKISKKDFASFKLSRINILRVVAVLILSYSSYVVSVAFICLATGIERSLLHCAEIGLIGVISSTIGLISIISPKGLGVQEASMYALLNNKFGITAALLLPIILRMVLLVSDVFLAIVSFICIRKELSMFFRKKTNMDTENTK